MILSPWVIIPSPTFLGVYSYYRYNANSSNEIVISVEFDPSKGYYVASYLPKMTANIYSQPKLAMDLFDEYAQTQGDTLLNDIQYAKLKCMT